MVDGVPTAGRNGRGARPAMRCAADRRSGFCRAGTDAGGYRRIFPPVAVINYLKQRIGEEQIAYIEKITPEYIKVIVPGLMDGIINYDSMPERTYMLPSGKLKGVDTGRVYKPGHKVLLTIKDATYVDKSIYYNLTLTECDNNKLTRKL